MTRYAAPRAWLGTNSYVTKGVVNPEVAERLHAEAESLWKKTKKSIERKRRAMAPKWWQNDYVDTDEAHSGDWGIWG